MIGTKIASLLAAFIVGLFGIGESDTVAATEAPVAEPVAVIESAAPVETAEPTPTPPVLENYDLSGSWYGYWEMFSCTGAWAQMEGFCWDGCAQIEDNVMQLWDQDVGKEPGLARIELDDSEPLAGISGGKFMDNTSGFDKWSLKLKQDEYGRLMTIRGNYVSERNGNFSFVFYLRPWGEQWPEGEGPVSYEDFFLPLMEQGKELPESFE